MSKRSENLDEKYILYLFEKYYSITIRGPTLIFADYCIVTRGQLLTKK